MLRRPVAAVVALGLLFFSATVSLEALGLLFHTTVPDLQQRVDAFVARLEADLSPVDLPDEPVEVPQELAGHAAGRVEISEPALEGDGVGERADEAEPDGRNAPLVATFVNTTPDVGPEAAAESNEVAAPAPIEARGPAAVLAPLPAVQPASAAPEAAISVARPNRARQATSARGPGGYAAFGWPLLDWLSL